MTPDVPAAADQAAESTKCQTPGAVFHVEIHAREVTIGVELPIDLDLSDEDAAVLDANMHNAMELVLARYFTHRTPLAEPADALVGESETGEDGYRDDAIAIVILHMPQTDSTTAR